MPEFSPRINESLSALQDDAKQSYFIGRTKSLQKKYGRDGALLLGRLTEEENHGKFVYLDALTPHVVFVAGSRGSGKSYSLGVMAEELIGKNPNISVVIIDPVGIYWSMKYPNQDEKELDELITMGMTPKGVDKTKVFIPYGVRQKLPKDTYDKTYALRPADLNPEDWCLTFGIDRFSPTGLLLEKALEKVSEGYVNADGKKIKAKAQEYSIDEIVSCLNTDVEITSTKKGFKTESRRALISRFEAAKAWGVFSENGTPLVELCKEGTVSVIDVSFLDENVTSLVIGLLSRKILNARKLSTRESAMKRMAVSMDDVLETSIPPTWLFIDEAHTLIPSGSKTAASNALIEYVKQGRRPGCSLVFATQQPAAIDSRVLSQLDILMCHKLVFDDDLKAVFKRMPKGIPKEYSSRFIKSLPIGACLVGDRSDETSRVFALKVRPRFSQHEGREARSVAMEDGLQPHQVEAALVKMVLKQIDASKRVHKKKVEQLVKTINTRYKTKITLDSVLKKVMDEGVVLDNDSLLFSDELSREQEKIDAEVEVVEQEEMLAFKLAVNEGRAREIVKSKKKKKFLFFGEEELVKKVSLEYWPVYKVPYDRFVGKGFKRSVLYVDGMAGEILKAGKKLEMTSRVSRLLSLNPNQRRIVYALQKGKSAGLKGISGALDVSESVTKKNLQELMDEGVVKESEGSYSLKEKLLPSEINSPEFTAVESRLVLDTVSGNAVQPRVAEEAVVSLPSAYGETKTRKVKFVYRPVWRAVLVGKSGKRDLLIDGMTGKVV